jgi:hypothetical protein
VSASTSLANRSATKILADKVVLDQVVQAISRAKAITYLDAIDAFQTRLEYLGPEATVGAVLGTDSADVLRRVLEQDASVTPKMLEHESVAEKQRQINLGLAYARAHPEVGVVKALEMASEGRLTLDEG